MSARGCIAAIATGLAIAACGASSGPRAPAAAPNLSVPPVLIAGDALHFPGEYLAWKVKWKGLAGGSAQLVVGEPGVVDGRRAIIVRSISQTEGLVAVFKHLRDELTTVVAVDSGAPIRADEVVEEGKSSERLEVRFQDGGYRLARRTGGAVKPPFSQAVPADAPFVQDLNSILAHLRAWSPAPGARGYFYIQSGRSFFRTELLAVGTEVMDTPVGKLDTVKIKGTARLLAMDGKPPHEPVVRHMSLWFSTDPQHLPVKLLAETSYGDVYAELVEHRPGRPMEEQPQVVGSSSAARTATLKSRRSSGVSAIHPASE